MSGVQEKLHVGANLEEGVIQVSIMERGGLAMVPPVTVVVPVDTWLEVAAQVTLTTLKAQRMAAAQLVVGP